MIIQLYLQSILNKQDLRVQCIIVLIVKEGTYSHVMQNIDSNEMMIDGNEGNEIGKLHPNWKWVVSSVQFKLMVYRLTFWYGIEFCCAKFNE